MDNKAQTQKPLSQQRICPTIHNSYVLRGMEGTITTIVITNPTYSTQTIMKSYQQTYYRYLTTYQLLVLLTMERLIMTIATAELNLGIVTANCQRLPPWSHRRRMQRRSQSLTLFFAYLSVLHAIQ